MQLKNEAGIQAEIHMVNVSLVHYYNNSVDHSEISSSYHNF